MTITHRLNKDFGPVPPDAMVSSPATSEGEPKPIIVQPPFGIGDIVQLKSGGCKLTVQQLRYRQGYGNDAFVAWDALVVWDHNGGDIKERWLPERVLRSWEKLPEELRPEPQGYIDLEQVKLGDCVHLVTGISPRMCVYEVEADTGVVKVEWFDDRSLRRATFYYWQLYHSIWTPKAK